MTVRREPEVRVVWAYGEDRGLADRLLHDLAAEDAAPGPIRRLCPWCGGGTHGRPVLPGLGQPHLSLARAGAVTVVAACAGAAIGIDVERARAADGDPSGLLHEREPAADPGDRAVTWVRKEALLKATGHGLRLDPTTIRMSAPAAPPALLEWPEPSAPEVWMCDVPTAPGYVAALAVMAAGPARVTVSQAAPGARSSTARG